MKKFFKYVFISLIAIVFIMMLINKSFLGFRLYKVVSGSMVPYLKINDVVLVKKQNHYKVNDVITYEKDKTVITHRIVKIDKDTIITQGDANNTEDEPITEKNIIGKVIYRFKLMGYLLYLFSQPKYLIIIFVLGLLITIFIPDKKKIKKGV